MAETSKKPYEFIGLAGLGGVTVAAVTLAAVTPTDDAGNVQNTKEPRTRSRDGCCCHSAVSDRSSFLLCVVGCAMYWYVLCSQICFCASFSGLRALWSLAPSLLSALGAMLCVLCSVLCALLFFLLCSSLLRSALLAPTDTTTTTMTTAPTTNTAALTNIY